jgi:hypothetical protein
MSRNQPGVSPETSPTAGPNQRRTNPPRPLPGGAGSKEKVGPIQSDTATLRETGADDAAAILASRAAADAPLDDPWAVASLLQALRETGADDAAATLASRAAANAPLDSPGRRQTGRDLARDGGAGDAAATLADRAAAGACLSSPEGVARLHYERPRVGLYTF